MIDSDRIAAHNAEAGSHLAGDVAHTIDVVGRWGIDAERGRRRGRRVFRSGAVVGGRNRRHALRALPDRRRAAHHLREGRRRRRPQRPYRRQPVDQPARAVGRPRRSRGPARLRGGTRHRVRRHELEHLPGQSIDHGQRHGYLQVRQPGQCRRRRAQGGDRAQPRGDRPRRAARLQGDHGVAGRRDEPPGTSELPRPVRTRVLDGLRQIHNHLPRRLADVHRAQAVTSPLSIRRSTTIGARHCCWRRALASSAGVWSTSVTICPTPTSSRS